MFFWSYENYHPYKPDGNLLQPAQRWRFFQMRQYFVYFMESFWSLFLHHIQEESLTAKEYLGWVVENLDLKYLSREWQIEFPKKNPLKLTVQEFYDSIKRSLPPKAWQDGTAAFEIPLNEQTLTLRIRRERSYHDVNMMAGSALIGLSLLYWRCLPWVGSSGWYYHTDRYAVGRLPFESHMRQVERGFTEGWPLVVWLQWLHQHCLWLQHRRVALEKLVSRRQEVYKFELLSDEPDNLVTDVQPKFHGIDVDVPKTNGPRFPSAMNILEDLSLIEQYKDGYKLTGDGLALLERFRTYKVPEWVDTQDDQTTEFAEETPS
jgi:hypothetical protein